MSGSVTVSEILHEKSISICDSHLDFLGTTKVADNSFEDHGEAITLGDQSNLADFSCAPSSKLPDKPLVLTTKSTLDRQSIVPTKPSNEEHAEAGGPHDPDTSSSGDKSIGKSPLVSASRSGSSSRSSNERTVPNTKIVEFHMKSSNIAHIEWSLTNTIVPMSEYRIYIHSSSDRYCLVKSVPAMSNQFSMATDVDLSDYIYEIKSKKDLKLTVRGVTTNNTFGNFATVNIHT